MKQYKYRGWPQMVFIAISLVFAAIAAIAAHRNPDARIQWWTMLIILPSQLPLLIEQRRLTEAEWRRREAENDERHQMIVGKAALITCAAGAVTLLGTMLFIVLREQENDTALLALTVVMLVPTLTFLIAQGVLNKRL